MNWSIMLFGGFVIIITLLIILILSFLAKGGDERKQLIQMKAMSLTFMVTIGLLVLNIFESIYNMFYNAVYEGINPFVFLTVVLFNYLVSLLIYKRKFGH